MFNLNPSNQANSDDTKQYNQANPDGTLIIDTEPILKPEQVKMIVKSAFNSTVWKVVWDREERARLLGTMTNNEGEVYNLNVHCKAISNTGRNSSNDKRIQMKDIEIIEGENSINLLLGVYHRANESVIIGWNIDSYLEPVKNHAPKISVKKIAEAMRDGFATFKISTEKKRNAYAFKPNFLISYALNLKNFYENDFVDDFYNVSEDEELQLEIVPNEIPKDKPKNLIVYGAPGTGKSHELETEAKDLFPDEFLRKRVTFYPKYSYSQFIGTYKPTPIYKKSESSLYDASMVKESKYQYEPLIDYKFELGPLLEMYCKAKEYPNHNFLLIIEEINRANAANVFGDFFQLLDREENGESTYSITVSENLMDALKATIQGFNETEIKLPSNLYIWATMNSGDQGVFPMDSAFKRRWTFKYLLLDKYEEKVNDKEIYLNFLKDKVSWNGFRNIINEFLANHDVPEDKLIGPFFLKKDEFENEEIFINKILLYLRDDVLRHNPTQLFMKSTFSQIVSDYSNNKQIFKDSIHNKLVGLV